MEVTQSIVNTVVDPVWAKNALDRNYEGNRRVRRAYVDQLSRVMKRGAFNSQNGQTLVIDAEDGTLYDGQHRLMALCDAGVTLVFAVAYVKDGKSAYMTIDNGTKRSASDFIDGPDKTTLSSVSRIMACVEWGETQLLSCLQGKMAPREQIDRSLVVDYYNQNREQIIRASRLGKRAYEATSKCVLAKAFAVFCCLESYFSNDNRIDDFVSDIVQKAPSNKTVQAYKTAVLSAALSSKSKPDLKWTLGTTADAYKHFMRDDGSTMLNKQQYMLDMYQKKLEIKRSAASAATNTAQLSVR